MNTAIEVKNLWFKYIGSTDWVLKDITFSIGVGETVVIMGPSGCGKSTLLYVLIGMIPHIIKGELRGYARVVGYDVREAGPEILGKKVGFVFQNPEIQVIMPSVIEELAFGLENLGLSREEIDVRIKEVLEFIGFKGRECAIPQTLSPGEKQVLAIATMLALKPEVIVLDEPTSMLDHLGTSRVLSLIEKLKKEIRTTLLIVEHRIEWIAEHADKIIVMEDGRIVDQGSPDEVFNKKDLVLKTGVRPPQISEIFYKILEKKPSFINKIPVRLAEAIELLVDRIDYWKKPEEVRGVAVEQPIDKREVVIEVENLWFRYGKNLPWVLCGVNLKVYKGEFLALIGHSGAGKTTLLKHFNGLLKPDLGTVKVLGYDIRKTPSSTLSRLVGMVFQNPEAQFFASTIYEEMSFALKKMKLSEKEIETRIREALEIVDLDKPLDKSPHLLSFGEKHRLAIATILAIRPRILVLDEPFSGLDYKRSLQLLRSLRRFVDQGGTVILVAHDLQLISEVADRVAVIHEGRIVREGPTEDVLGDIDWLKEYNFTPLQSAVLATKLGLGRLIKTDEIAYSILKHIK